MSARRVSDLVKTTKATLRHRRPSGAAERLVDPPPAPETLTPAAAREWDGLAAVLVERGVLTLADLRGLELLAATLAFVAELEAAIRAEGLTVPSGSGGRKGHPGLGALAQARAAAHRLLADFGLLPRARAGVDQAPDARPASNPASEFFD